LGKKVPHESTGSIGVTVLVTFQTNDSDILSADKIIQVFGAIAENHIKTLDSCQITGMHPKEDERLNLHHRLKSLAFSEIVLCQNFVLRHKVLFGWENGGNVLKSNIVTLLNLGKSKMTIPFLYRCNNFFATYQGLHKQIKRIFGKNETFHYLPPVPLKGNLLTCFLIPYTLSFHQPAGVNLSRFSEDK
jgi:hypothetical protein